MAAVPITTANPLSECPASKHRTLTVRSPAQMDPRHTPPTATAYTASLLVGSTLPDLPRRHLHRRTVWKCQHEAIFESAG